MIGTVKIEFGVMNLYVNGVCVASSSSIAGIKHAAKRYNLQGYLMAAEWKLCFFIWQNFLGVSLSHLKFLSKKIPPSVAANGGWVRQLRDTVNISRFTRIARKNRQNFYPGDFYVWLCDCTLICPWKYLDASGWLASFQSQMQLPTPQWTS